MSALRWSSPDAFTNSLLALGRHRRSTASSRVRRRSRLPGGRAVHRRGRARRRSRDRSDGANGPPSNTTTAAPTTHPTSTARTVSNDTGAVTSRVERQPEHEDPTEPAPAAGQPRRRRGDDRRDRGETGTTREPRAGQPTERVVEVDDAGRRARARCGRAGRRAPAATAPASTRTRRYRMRWWSSVTIAPPTRNTIASTR